MLRTKKLKKSRTSVITICKSKNAAPICGSGSKVDDDKTNSSRNTKDTSLDNSCSQQIDIPKNWESFLGELVGRLENPNNTKLHPLKASHVPRSDMPNSENVGICEIKSCDNFNKTVSISKEFFIQEAATDSFEKWNSVFEESSCKLEYKFMNKISKNDSRSNTNSLVRDLKTEENEIGEDESSGCSNTSNTSIDRLVQEIKLPFGKKSQIISAFEYETNINKNDNNKFLENDRETEKPKEIKQPFVRKFQNMSTTYECKTDTSEINNDEFVERDRTATLPPQTTHIITLFITPDNNQCKVNPDEMFESSESDVILLDYPYNCMHSTTVEFYCENKLEQSFSLQFESEDVYDENQNLNVNEVVVDMKKKNYDEPTFAEMCFKIPMNNSDENGANSTKIFSGNIPGSPLNETNNIEIESSHTKSAQSQFNFTINTNNPELSNYTLNQIENYCCQLASEMKKNLRSCSNDDFTKSSKDYSFEVTVESGSNACEEILKNETAVNTNFNTEQTTADDQLAEFNPSQNQPNSEEVLRRRLQKSENEQLKNGANTSKIQQIPIAKNDNLMNNDISFRLASELENKFKADNAIADVDGKNTKINLPKMEFTLPMLYTELDSRKETISDRLAQSVGVPRTVIMR
ncbi:hypothetical protein HELRODRAFT_183650 [Helobdella robusta]|uniref:Uncharacterized protein n=1 Tax=Helobdella robusta TaxID=6412 RepID=T1FJZ8_HELRO|nr:hypothetical protein HELRODRAFT_183650 [Helobdella robusta]ESO10428.1 hypothetical protein HELRODRAFT_183650 [Helobdella robusta]